MRSIRLFLVAAIVATLTLFNFIAVLQGYQSSIEQAEILFDNQLEDIALLVARVEASPAIDKLELENNIIFQRWQDGRLDIASANAPADPVAPFEPGFGFANFDGYRWRTIALNDAEQGRWVLVAERSDLRFVLAENVVLASVIPILLGIPLVGLLIWLIVSFGLRPLKVLSTELKRRPAQDFSPVHYANTNVELEQVVQSINSFIRRLGRVLEREQRFSADAAHELRTPISALKIQLHNLQDEIGPDNESFRQLQSGVDRMQHLIEQLLSLSRTTPENFSENAEILDLYELAQEQIARLYQQFEDRDQTLELEGDSQFVEGERFALGTLLSNLLTNANKYTPRGGTIIVSVVAEGEWVNLVVEDNGSGIAAADRERIFDRFYRSDHLADPALVPGCGLGLTIVTQIAELHHAEVSVADSRFDTGVAFKVRFRAKHD